MDSHRHGEREPAPAAVELYIYYRVPAATAPLLHRAASTMQQQLAQDHPGLAARLLCRADDGHHTWMEIYVLPRGADVAAMAAAIDTAALALTPWLLGPRHTERFTACA